MQIIKNLTAFAIASSFLGSVLAAPAANDVAVDVNEYSDDVCSQHDDQIILNGSGSYRCAPVSSSKRSIRYNGNCKVTTWSGNNCRGSSFVVPDNGCHSVLYGSVQIQC